MRLTPLDIRKQDFTRGFRGYDAEEVQAFLQMLSNQWEEMLDQHRRLEEKKRELENKIQHYEKVEEALQEALQTARESSRKVLDNAEKKAELIIAGAEARADEIRREAEDERHSIKRDATNLTGRRDEIVARLRAFLMAEMEILARFEGDDPIGFIKLLPAEEQRHARTRAGRALPPERERGGLEPEAPAAREERREEPVEDEPIEEESPFDENLAAEMEPDDDAYETEGEGPEEEADFRGSEMPTPSFGSMLRREAEEMEEEEEGEEAEEPARPPAEDPPRTARTGWTVRPLVSARTPPNRPEAEEEDEPAEDDPASRSGLSASDEEIEKIRRILKDLD